MGESQPGHVPFHRIRQGLMPPDQIQIGWFHASFLDNPRRKSDRLDASPPGGVRWKPLIQDLDMKFEDVGFPLWGTRCAHCRPPFVSLWALWAALTRLKVRFHLRTLSC
jgi:hypothetical protein